VLALSAITVTLVVLVAVTSHDAWWLVWRAWGFVLLGAGTGAAVAWAVRQPQRRLPSSPPVATDRGSASPPAASSAKDGLLAREMVELLDTLPNESQRYQVHRALSDAGIVEFGADGDLFDPERHEVVDVEWTDDPSRESRVARTVRAGYADGTRVIRAAEVLVYRGSRTPRAGVSGRTG
jgi:hypothetical protein